MFKYYLKQIQHLWKSNPLFSTKSVLATALTIAFVMILYMVYAFRTTDIAPENNRSRILYSEQGYSYFTKDNSSRERGMSAKTAEAIFGNLENAEAVSYCAYRGEGAAYVGTSPANSEKRIINPVDDVFFQIFKLQFVAGKPFTHEQVEAGRRECIITDEVAMKLFNTTDVIGKNINVNFFDYRITGVVKSVSSFFNKVYSDVWLIANKENMNWAPDRNEGLVGHCVTTVLAKKGVSLKELEKEIDEKIATFNDQLIDFTFEQSMLTQAQASFFQGDRKINPAQIFILLIFILLVVPAINMSGLLSTQMKKRNEEIGIRKAYGASNWQVGSQLLFENFVLTIVGGVVGLLLSFIALAIFKNILLADIMTINAGESFDLPLALFFNPSIFLLMFLFCLVINLLSAIVPVWNASRTTIVQTIKGE